jgi:heme exporter protein A
MKDQQALALESNNLQQKSDNRLKIEGLTVFRSELPLFEPVSFNMKAGEATQIKGTNGSGKTSLLRCLCGLSHRHQGLIRWNDANVDSVKDDFYAQLLYIGHALGLKPKLSVEQNLDFYQQLRFTQDQAIILQALEQLKIGAYHDELVGNLSAGQKRRVALARIISEPVSLWVLDEPMVALDVEGQAWLEQTCNQHLSDGGMIILTSHQTIKGINGLTEYRLNETNWKETYLMDEGSA